MSPRLNVGVFSTTFLLRRILISLPVDWADLVTLDLSQFDTPGGKERLAKQLDEAVHKVGFL